MGSNSRNQLESWLKTLEVKGDVLDIGGSVQTLEGRVKSFNTKKYLIMDNNAEEKFHDKWIKPNIKWDINFPMSGTFWNDKFDQIFMIEVSEYLYDPYMALLNVLSMLKKGGKFYSSWHFIYPKHNPEGKDLLRYTIWGVEKLHKLAGFKDINIIPRVAENYEELFSFYSKEKMRAIKHYKHNDIGYMCEATK